MLVYKKDFNSINRKEKVIFLIYSLAGGGAERVLSELSFNLSSRFEQSIVLFKKEVVYRHRGKPIFLKTKNFHSCSVLSKIYKFFERMYKFRQVVKKEKPNLVISFGEGLNFLNIVSFGNSIITVHLRPSDTDKHNGFLIGLIYKILRRILYNKSLQIVAVSHGIKDDLMKNFGIKGRKIKVIYNPIDIKNTKKLAKEPLKISLENPIILGCGRLVEQKGFSYLIKAFPLVLRKYPRAKLLILGKGEKEKELRDLVRNLNIKDNVEFLGFQKNPFKFMARANIFVLSSLCEGFSMVLLEAMACGCPVVSTDCQSGPREILAPDTDFNYQTKSIEFAKYGILTPVANPNALAEGIIELLDNPKLREEFSKKGQERSKDFNIKKIIKQYENLFLEILNKEQEQKN